MQGQGVASILWRGRWMIVVCTLVGVVLAIVVTRSTAKVYEAQATIEVGAGGVNATNVTPNEVQLAAQGEALTDATLIGTRSFLNAIRPHVLGGRLTTSALEGRISASAITNTSLVQITAHGPKPSEARRVANDVARGFVSYVRSASGGTTQVQLNQIEKQLTTVSTQIQRLEAAGGTSPQLASLRAARAALANQLAGTVAARIVQGANVRLTAPATASSSPVQPRPLLNLIAGVLIGLLAGIALAWLRVRLDRRLHGSEEVEELLDAPVLATIPLRRKFSSQDPVLREAFDVLRTNLAFIAHDRPLRVLTVASYNAREGKTSAVEGLAFAAARGGANVLVVDGDIRKRALSQRLGYGAAKGLTSLIVGASELDDALVSIADGVWLLPAGATPPNPPSLLSSRRMEQILEELRAQFDLVVIDSPPVAHLADGSILASVSDGVALLARVGVTARTDLAEATVNLRHGPTPILGVVVLERQAVDEDYYIPVARDDGRRAPQRERAGAA